MPTPTVQQVRDAVVTLREQNPDMGVKNLLTLLNTNNDWDIKTKEFRMHLAAVKGEPISPSPEVLRASIEALRAQNPNMGTKRFANLLNASRGWSVGTKEIRECLEEVDP